MSGFFTAPVNGLDGADKILGYDLLPSGASSGVPYEHFWVLSYSGANVDLNLYEDSTGAAQTEAFSTSTPAFTGEMRGDFSAFAGFLPSNGATGGIFENYNDAPRIGSWEVQMVAVPEPSTYGVCFGLAALGFGVIRRKRRAAREEFHYHRALGKKRQSPGLFTHLVLRRSLWFFFN